MARHLYGPNGGALPSRPDGKISPERASVALLNPQRTRPSDVWMLVDYSTAMMKRSARKKRRQHGQQVVREALRHLA